MANQNRQKLCLEHLYIVACPCSGVATYGALGHVPSSSFGNYVHSAAAASLTVNISKITKEDNVMHFRLSHQNTIKLT